MDMQQATDALGRQFAGSTSAYVASPQLGFQHQAPHDTRQGAESSDPQVAHSKEFARVSLERARAARLAGDLNAADYHLRNAGSARGNAQDRLGIRPGKRVFQRPGVFRFGDKPATRRLP